MPRGAHAPLLAQRNDAPDGLHQVHVGPGHERLDARAATDADTGLGAAVAADVHREHRLARGGRGPRLPALLCRENPPERDERFGVLRGELSEHARRVAARPGAQLARQPLDARARRPARDRGLGARDVGVA